MKKQTIKLGITLAVGSILLAGCNPPMPPEVLAAIAEKSFTCVEGETATSFSQEVSEGIDYLGENLTANCPGMTMSFTDATSASLVASSKNNEGPASTAYATVPYAVESGVFAITSAAGATALLTPDAVRGIVDGSITSWSDPIILEANGGIAPLEGNLTLVPQSQTESVAALGAWYKHFTGKTLETALDTSKSVTVADYQDLPEGSVAFMPGAVFTSLSSTALVTPMAANLLTDIVNYPAGATPDTPSIQAGASQWKVVTAPKALTVELDYAAKPVPPLGFDVSPAPYQILYAVNLSLFGNDSLATRATARYLLRQDSQGSLALVAGLPVTVRAESLAFVSKGLPEPEDTDAPAN